jgi:hypothetical protein
VKRNAHSRPVWGHTFRELAATVAASALTGYITDPRARKRAGGGGLPPVVVIPIWLILRILNLDRRGP